MHVLLNLGGYRRWTHRLTQKTTRRQIQNRPTNNWAALLLKGWRHWHPAPSSSVVHRLRGHHAPKWSTLTGDSRWVKGSAQRRNSDFVQTLLELWLPPTKQMLLPNPSGYTHNITYHKAQSSKDQADSPLCSQSTKHRCPEAFTTSRHLFKMLQGSGLDASWHAVGHWARHLCKRCVPTDISFLPNCVRPIIS